VLRAGTRRTWWHVGWTGAPFVTGARPVGELIARVNRVRLGIQESQVWVVITGVPVVIHRGPPAVRPPGILPWALLPAAIGAVVTTTAVIACSGALVVVLAEVAGEGAV
jgi:hypothetical protein